MHGGRVGGLDADDAHARVELLDVGGDATDQATAPHRHEDRIDLAAGLADDFHADGALPRDHIRIVEGMHESQPLGARQSERVLVGGIVELAVQQARALALDFCELPLAGAEDAAVTAGSAGQRLAELLEFLGTAGQAP